MSPGSQISHIATNKGNINRQCLIYNILSIKGYNLRHQIVETQLCSLGEDSNSIGTTDWLITKLISPNSNNLVPTWDLFQICEKLSKRKYMSHSTNKTWGSCGLKG